MRTINLTETKTIVLVKEQTIDANQIYYKTEDDGQQVTAFVDFGVSLGSQTLILWSGDDYNNIGQWTDEQADARILELLSL